MKNPSILLVIALAFGATVHAQSLADFARQERERKKSIESKIVITNDSLRTPSSAAQTTAQTPATTAEQAEASKQGAAEAKPAGPTGPTDRQGRDEKYWRTAFEQAREELSRAENQVKAQELRVNKANTELLQRSDFFNKEQQIGSEIRAANTDMDNARKSVEQAKQKLSLLEEDLRRSGGPAGWSR